MASLVIKGFAPRGQEMDRAIRPGDAEFAVECGFLLEGVLDGQADGFPVLWLD